MPVREMPPINLGKPKTVITDDPRSFYADEDEIVDFVRAEEDTDNLSW